MTIRDKLKLKIRNKLLIQKDGKSRIWLYPTYWHQKFFRGQENQNTVYFGSCPNIGAGIGHQIANWISGYWFAKKFDVQFVHVPFSAEKWEKFLGFYQDDKVISELKKSGYRIRRLPLFDEKSEKEVKVVKKIIDSYQGKQVILLTEQDQCYHDQYGVKEEIKSKFYSAPTRQGEKLIFQKDAFNIAIHVRRGDIVQQEGENNPNLTMRFQGNKYFVNALKTAMDYFQNESNIHIYLFSQGKPEDYLEFSHIPNLHLCLDMGAQDSFLHMVYADALITSKSSFSYKPALLNRGIKFCPEKFWHGYPKSEDWILLNENGEMM